MVRFPPATKPGVTFAASQSLGSYGNQSDTDSVDVERRNSGGSTHELGAVASLRPQSLPGNVVPAPLVLPATTQPHDGTREILELQDRLSSRNMSSGDSDSDAAGAHNPLAVIGADSPRSAGDASQHDDATAASALAASSATVADNSAEPAAAAFDAAASDTAASDPAASDAAASDAAASDAAAVPADEDTAVHDSRAATPRGDTVEDEAEGVICAEASTEADDAPLLAGTQPSTGGDDVPADADLSRTHTAQSTDLMFGMGLGAASTQSMLRLPSVDGSELGAPVDTAGMTPVDEAGDDASSTGSAARAPQVLNRSAVVEFVNESTSAPASVAGSQGQQQEQEQVVSVVRADDGESVVLPPQAAIADALPGAVMVADSQGTIVYTNDHFTRLLGYSREAAIGSSLALFVPSDSLKSLQNMIRRLIVTGSAGKRGTDGKGTQIDVLSNMGEAVPVLLNVNRMSHNNRYWVVGDMQDLRHHVQGGADVEEVRWCYLACILVWG